MMASNYQRKLKLLQSKQSLAIKLVICLILLLMISVGGTIAFVVTHTSEIRNTFTESVVKCEVDETFEDNVKSNVSIKNTGDTTAYIRAFVNVTWMNESKQVASVSPIESTDYIIDIDCNHRSMCSVYIQVYQYLFIIEIYYFYIWVIIFFFIKSISIN